MSATTPQLRRATESDIEFLADVVLLSVEDRYQKRPDWDRDTFRRGLVEDAADQVAGRPENSVTYVIVAGGVEVGRLRLVTTATEVEIAGLQVLPDHQNGGIGTAVITRVIDQADAAGLPVILEVETDWRALAEQWAADELHRLGRSGWTGMTDISDHAWSTVWRIPIESGDVVLKQTTGPRRREGDIIAFCAEVAPDQVDGALATDPTAGRVLLIDRGPTLYDTNPQTRGLDLATVQMLITEYARLQQATIGHGDLWPGNVIPTNRRNQFRFIDFGDAAWSHPFLSMIMMVAECRHHWSVPDRSDGLNLDQADRQTLTELGHLPWAWLEDITFPILP